MLVLMFSGCSADRPEDPEKQKLRYDLEEARSDNSTLKLVAGLLVAATVIALIVGAALGSKAKEDGDGE